MTTNNAIDQAIKTINLVINQLDAEDVPAKYWRPLESALTDLRALKDRGAVDIEGLKRECKDAFYNKKRNPLDPYNPIMDTIDHLAAQGYIVGPDAPQPPASAVDVEAIKCEIWQAIAEKHQNAQGDIRAETVVETIDYMVNHGLIGQDLSAVREQIEGLRIDMTLDNSNTDTPGGWSRSVGYNAALDAVLSLINKWGV